MESLQYIIFSFFSFMNSESFKIILLQDFIRCWTLSLTFSDFAEPLPAPRFKKLGLFFIFTVFITNGDQATTCTVKRLVLLSNIAVTLVDQETTLCSNGIKRNICVSSHLNYEQNGYAFVRLWLTGLYAALAQRRGDSDVTMMSYILQTKVKIKMAEISTYCHSL